MNTQAQPMQADTDMDISDWAGSPMSTMHPPEPAVHPVSSEAFLKDGQYVVRFELPGVDPVKDIAVSVEAQVLTVSAERHDSVAGKYHAKFRYGLFSGHVALPAGTDDSDVTATSENGVLTVTVGYQSKAKHTARRIPVGTVQRRTVPDAAAIQ